MNFNNICYANSLIQIFYHSCPFVVSIQRHKEYETEKQILDIFEKMKRNNEYNLYPFIQSLNFQGDNDPHEFWIELLNKLHNDTREIFGYKYTNNNQVIQEFCYEISAINESVIEEQLEDLVSRYQNLDTKFVFPIYINRLNYNKNLRLNVLSNNRIALPFAIKFNHQYYIESMIIYLKCSEMNSGHYIAVIPDHLEKGHWRVFNDSRNYPISDLIVQRALLDKLTSDDIIKLQNNDNFYNIAHVHIAFYLIH